MEHKAGKGSVPPGFVRPLTLGETPLMACADRYARPEDPAKRTYRMKLPSSAVEARGYHALRLLRLRQLQLKQRWHKALLFFFVAFIGLCIIFWNQLTLPIFILFRNISLVPSFIVTHEDVARCDAGGLPTIYMNDDLISWRGEERTDWLREAWQKTDIYFAPRSMDFHTYTMIMTLFEGVTQALLINEIDFALVGGSLVGSYLFHDSLPWGRGFSLAARADDKEKLKSILSNLNLVDAIRQNRAYSSTEVKQLVESSKARLQVKRNSDSSAQNRSSDFYQVQIVAGPTTEYVSSSVYLSSQVAPIFGITKKWRVSVKTSNTHPENVFSGFVIYISWWIKGYSEVKEAKADLGSSTEAVVFNTVTANGDAESLRIPATEWFPLTLRPFGLLLLPAPFNPLYYINVHYQVSQPYCAPRWQSRISAYSYLRTSCRLIRNVYPHVDRHQIAEGCVRELLIFNGRVRFTSYICGRDKPLEENGRWLFRLK